MTVAQWDLVYLCWVITFGSVVATGFTLRRVLEHRWQSVASVARRAGIENIQTISTTSRGRVTSSPLDWLHWLRAAIRAKAQAKEIQDLKDRITKLEARQENLIAEAKAAAASAASAVASQHVAELAREIGAKNERTPGEGSDPLTAP